MTGEQAEQWVDVVVLGAGISGLVSASVIIDQGAKSVLVVDQYDRVGGNHIDAAINGYTFDVGSLIFQDDSPLVERFPELMSSYVPITPTWERLNPQGLVVRYPFSVRDDIISAGPIEWVRMALSVIYARLFRRELNSARDFAEHWLGVRFAWRTGLMRYMERLCGTPPELIDLKFAESRMGWIPEHAGLGNQLRSLISRRRSSRPPGPPNRQLVRPRSGFAELYRPVTDRLAANGVEFLLGQSLQGLERDGDGFILRTASRVIHSDRVVSTVPLDLALRLIGVQQERLPTVTLVTLYFSFAGERGFDSSILYNFAQDGSWKRLTVHSDFYGELDSRQFFAVEVIDGENGPSAHRAERQFREHTSANGLFAGDLRLEGSNVLTNAYPIFTAGSFERARDDIARLKAFGVESHGRQGGFEYQPTARQSTHIAERALGARGPGA